MKNVFKITRKDKISPGDKFFIKGEGPEGKSIEITVIAINGVFGKIKLQNSRNEHSVSRKLIQMWYERRLSPEEINQS